MMALWYDKKAYALLKKCSDARDLTEWNEYRKETNHAPINLRFANLKDFYLMDADLGDVDFRGSNLKKSLFENADVTGLNISHDIYWKLLFSTIIFISIMLLLQGLFEIAKQSILAYFIWIFVLFLIPTVIIIINFPYWSNSNDDALMAFSKALMALVIIPLLAIILRVIFIDTNIAMKSIFAIFDSHNSFFKLIHTAISYSESNSIIFISISMTTIIVILNLIDTSKQSIAYAKNPEKAIGFDTKYLKDISIPLSSRSEKEIAVLKELLEKKQNEKEKQTLQYKLEELQKEKEDALKTEAYAKTQQIKIQNALNHILKPYEYMERNISKLRKHNYFFYGVIGILLGAFVYALSAHYLDARSSHFLDVLKKETVSFGSLFGVIFFYATPILFGMSIIVYAIAQINKNIQSIEGMQEQKRAIEVLQSTLLAQTEIADVSDDEIKALTQALQKGALEKMFGKDKPTEKTPKEKSTYREKLLITNLSKALTQALK